MGSLNAMGMAEAVNDGLASLETALHYHLRSNHFPPVPVEMIPVAVAAITAANDGDWDRLVDLPEGVSWRGHEKAPASGVIESFHLDAFLEGDDDDFWDDDEDES